MTDPHHDRRWLILAVIGIAQLLVVLDVTIVNIALPSAQHDLGFSDDDRQWVITAYALAFGSLLLLGGRIADLFGRKWTFIVGLLGFAGASALGGAAQSFGLLVGARALQGVFAAMLAPAALSLLATTFTDPAERGKAFGVYGAIAGVGGAVGLLLGGFLTEVLDWRWCLYVSILFAVPAAIGGVRLLHQVPAPNRPRLDIPGTIVASSGLFALVFGLSRAETDGWGEPVTLAFLGASALLLVAFVALQRRVANPLLPLRVVTDRNRGGAFLAIATASAGIFGVFLFLTFYLQNTKGFSAFETGLAFLPMSFSIVVTATLVNTRVLARTGPRPLVPTGMLLASLGMVLLTAIGVDT
jgi:EmrB/QacA subfamily drug resistance transporter